MNRSLLSFVLISIIFVASAIPVDDVEEYKKEKAELTKSCPKNSEFSQCTNLCPKSCANFDTVSACFSLRCGNAGCNCKDGHILLDNSDHTKGCVTREVCREIRKQGKI